MKLFIDDLEVEFKQNTDRQTNRLLGEWATSIQINNSRYDIYFNEEIFKDHKSQEVSINWEIVKHFIKILKENLEELIIKSINVLIPLHQQIFGNEYIDRDGYFDLDGIEITEFRNYLYSDLDFFTYQFELGFALESNQMFVMDSLCYYSTFECQRKTDLILVGVARG